jgi:hypothetical protein
MNGCVQLYIMTGKEQPVVAEALEHIFVQNGLPKEFSSAFAEGMHGFYSASRVEGLTHRQKAFVMLVKDQLWAYTPHFRRAIASALQILFKTQIVGMAMCPVSVDQSVIFVDDTDRRWVFAVEAGGAMYAFFPRPNTITLVINTLTAEELNDPASTANGQKIVIYNTVELMQRPSLRRSAMTALTAPMDGTGLNCCSVCCARCARGNSGV